MSVVGRVCHLSATLGRIGYAPKGSGTLGALAAIPLAWAFAQTTMPIQIALVIGVCLLSIPIANRYHVDTGKKDPSEVIIDEVAGCLLTLLFVPWSWLWVAAGFGLFRFFDIVKPWPVSAAERLDGGLGIVLDDLVAGLMAGLVLLGARYWL